MAKAKKKAVRPAKPRGPAFPAVSLAPRVLEQAAQGWLQSAGTAAPSSRPAHPACDHRLAEALTETLQALRAEISALRARIESLENQ